MGPKIIRVFYILEGNHHLNECVWKLVIYYHFHFCWNQMSPAPLQSSNLQGSASVQTKEIIPKYRNVRSDRYLNLTSQKNYSTIFFKKNHSTLSAARECVCVYTGDLSCRVYMHTSVVQFPIIITNNNIFFHIHSPSTEFS